MDMKTLKEATERSARKPSGKIMHNNAIRLNIKPSNELKASV